MSLNLKAKRGNCYEILYLPYEAYNESPEKKFKIHTGHSAEHELKANIIKYMDHLREQPGFKFQDILRSLVTSDQVGLLAEKMQSSSKLQSSVFIRQFREALNQIQGVAGRLGLEKEGELAKQLVDKVSPAPRAGSIATVFARMSGVFGSGKASGPGRESKVDVAPG